MGAIEPWHLVLLLMAILLMFGPGKLPQVGKGVGEAIREFRNATSEIRDSARIEQTSARTQIPPPTIQQSASEPGATEPPASRQLPPANTIDGGS